MNETSLGTLYVVATPIGNLEDCSPRAKRILAEVAVIAAEDTRYSGKLLRQAAIATPLLSLHEHNEKQRCGQLIARLLNGEDMALISDAGTPLISDPGYRLVVAAWQHAIPLCAIPGPCAAIAALSVAGIASDRFVFEGFLPQSPKARGKRLQLLAQEPRTLLFYEAPHRLLAMLADCITFFGADRLATLSKEITKLFEAHCHGTLTEIQNWLMADSLRQKGEFVLVVAGCSAVDELLTPEVKRIFALLRTELPLNQAAKLTASITGVAKNVLYDYGLTTPAPCV